MLKVKDTMNSTATHCPTSRTLRIHGVLSSLLCWAVVIILFQPHATLHSISSKSPLPHAMWRQCSCQTGRTHPHGQGGPVPGLSPCGQGDRSKGRYVTKSQANQNASLESSTHWQNQVGTMYSQSSWLPSSAASWRKSNLGGGSEVNTQEKA